MKLPGPDHPITVTPAGRRMRARIGQHVIADTPDAVLLKEADYPAVVYFPRGGVETGFLSKTDRTTHCPYKGDASYYSIMMDGELLENVVWSYEAPFPAMEAIGGLLAFYTDRVEVYAAPDESEEGLFPEHLQDGVTRPQGGSL